jgi:hypothetical protein
MPEHIALLMQVLVENPRLCTFTASLQNLPDFEDLL